MVRKLVLAAALAALVGGGLAIAQIVPATPGGGGTPPAADPGAGGIVPGRPPGAGPGAETENDKAFKALLAGTWRLDLQAPQGWSAWVEATYSADGTFSGSQVSVSPNPAPYNRTETRLIGTYAVKALDRSNFSLTLTYTSPPMTPPATATLTYIDQNTLYNVGVGRNATRIQ